MGYRDRSNETPALVPKGCEDLDDELKRIVWLNHQLASIGRLPSSLRSEGLRDQIKKSLDSMSCFVTQEQLIKKLESDLALAQRDVMRLQEELGRGSDDVIDAAPLSSLSNYFWRTFAVIVVILITVTIAKYFSS